MSYIGENKILSFRDNFCEPRADKIFTPADAAEFGLSVASMSKSFAVGCSDENMRHFMFAFCSGLSGGGANVYFCDDSDLPSFRYGINIADAEYGIFISGSSTPKFSFFFKNGFPLSSSIMLKFMNSSGEYSKNNCGKITIITALTEIYTDNITNNVKPELIPFSIGVSCGNDSIRKLWKRFFSGKNEDFIFQVSDNGNRVNAFNTEIGFISQDKLILAYCVSLWQKGTAAVLPVDFHFAADDAARSCGFELLRFNPEKEIPREAIEQRFLNDSLYMCTQIAADYENFLNILKSLPSFASAKREITAPAPNSFSFCNPVKESAGVVRISPSGKNRVTLIAQAYDAETAAELCSVWDDKIRRMGSCTNLFHPRS